jgi:hypothetical protein
MTVENAFGADQLVAIAAKMLDSFIVRCAYIFVYCRLQRQVFKVTKKWIFTSDKVSIMLILNRSSGSVKIPPKIFPQMVFLKNEPSRRIVR